MNQGANKTPLDSANRLTYDFQRIAWWTMNLQISISRRILGFAVILIAVGFLSAPFRATAQPEYVVKPVAEKKLKELPAGPLYWRVENFPTLARAQAAEGPASLAAEVAGKVWLFTLGPKGGASTGGSNVVEIGPVPAIS